MMATALPIGRFDGHELSSAQVFSNESTWLRSPKQLACKGSKTGGDVH